MAGETTTRRGLLSTLNSLGDEFEAKAQTQADDCLDDGCVAGAGRHSVNKGAVDLQTRMATGTVKWFNATKSFGFIQPDGGGQDVFVHISAVERAGVSTLVDGQKVNYRIEQDRRTGKLSAGNLSKAGLTSHVISASASGTQASVHQIDQVWWPTGMSLKCHLC